MLEPRIIPIGYNALIEKFKLKALPHFRNSYIALSGRGRTILNHHIETHIYPKTYAFNNFNDPLLHIEFALKYDGINLHLLQQIFLQIDQRMLVEYIIEKPASKYSRIIWFLYEWLTQEKLNIEDCHSGNYVNLLDPHEYYVCTPIKRARYRINDNLLGNRSFCPMIRRTPLLNKYENLKLDQRLDQLLEQYDSSVIARASNYLYSKETKSSYEIEHEHPQQNRIVKFIKALKDAAKIESLNKNIIIELQNVIVDPRYQDKDYRHSQNYVGENVGAHRQKIHYISPKPEDVTDLMNGLLAALERMIASKLHPVVIAAAISFGFVFIHPFEDGNGRLHRFLIHYILSKQEFTPHGLIFPVSAVMLKNLKKYDQVLEHFSVPLLELIQNYFLDEEGVLTINQETKYLYQFLDYSLYAEYLFSCIEEAITTDFKDELGFVIGFSQAKHAIEEIVDMPDKKINLMIQFVIQNQGKLASKKREKYFPELTELEINKIVTIVQKFMMKK